MEITMTTGTEALVRRAYHFAEGAVLDVRGFTGLFAEDGVLTGIGDPSGPESYRGEHLGDVVVFMGKFCPTRAKVDIPTADFWHLRNGKIQEFNCHIGVAAMFAQLGVLPDFTSAVAASAPPR
jgi:hypothetical protein